MKTINSCIFKFRKFFKVFKTKFKWESCRTIFCPSLTSVSSKVCFIKRKFQKFSEAAVCRYSTKIFLFKTWFFSLKKTEWNKLDFEIQNSESISIFKKNLAKFVRSFPDRVFNGHDPHGIKVFNSCDRGWVTFVNINLNIVNSLSWTLFANVEVRKLNLALVTSCNV